MYRRTFLASVGAATVGLAGCSQSGDDTDGSNQDGSTSDSDTPMGGAGGTSTPTSTLTPTPTSTPTPFEVDVTFLGLQPGVVTPNSPDSIEVTYTNGQFVYLSVRVDGDQRPPPADFSFSFDGTVYGQMPLDGGFRDTPWQRHMKTRYSVDNDGWMLFQLPESGDASDTALRWPGGEWTPEDTLKQRLGTPTPPFVVSVDAPEAIDPGAQPRVTTTVENQGEVPGGFVIALNRVGPRVAHTPVEMETFVVPAGDRHRWEWTATDLPTDVPASSRMDAIDYHVHWHDGSVTRTVRITDPRTTTGGTETPTDDGTATLSSPGQTAFDY